MKPETQRWVRHMEDDLKVAALALEHDLIRSAMFHSHEAVEKSLKAVWIETTGEEPERTHNLPYLAEELGIELSPEQREFLRKLYWQLIPSRYPEGSEPDPEAAEWYYEQARDFVSWLLRTLK